MSLDEKQQSYYRSSKMLFLMSVGLYLFSQSANPAIESPSEEDVFSEQAEVSSIVVWKDVEIPVDKSYRNVVVMNGNLKFYGTTQNLVVVGGTAILEKGSKVTEQLVNVNGQIQELMGAEVASPLDNQSDGKLERAKNWLNNWKEDLSSRFSDFDYSPKMLFFPWLLWLPAFFVLVLMVFASLFFRMAPNLSRSAEYFLVSDFWVTFVWGAVAFLVFAPAVKILFITIVGILFIPVLLFAALLVIAGGLLCICRSFGRWLLTRVISLPLGLATIVGLFVALAIFSVPYFGHLVFAISSVSGSGAILRALFDRRGKEKAVHTDWRATA